jgi:hypothetical protein
MANTDIIMEAAERVFAGEKIGAVLAETGLKYSPVWLTARWLELTAESPELFVAEPTAAKAVALRDQGCSWGEIAVRFSPSAPRAFPESRVRAWFKEESGLKSQGLRTGRGGRYFAGRPEFYDGELVRPGTEIPKDMPIEVAVSVATLIDHETQELLALGIKELRAMAKGLGIKTGSFTKAQLIRAIRTARKAAAVA